MNFTSKTIIVTGASSGIGAAAARLLAEAGANLVLAARREAMLEDVRDGLGENAAKAVVLAGDVSDEAYNKALVDRAIETFGGLEGAFNNAGIQGELSPTAECSEENWDRITGINLKGVWLCMKFEIAQMLKQGGGAIVNMGSNSWWEAGGGMPVYTTAKAAVHGMTRSFARDLGPHRIRVNTVVPGWIMTERQKELWVTDAAIDKHRDRQCLKDLIDPVYVARMVLFLASDDAAMCTANNYMVEAGSI